MSQAIAHITSSSINLHMGTDTRVIFSEMLLSHRCVSILQVHRYQSNKVPESRVVETLKE